MAAVGDHSRKKVAYYYDREVGSFYYGDKHPMKPKRLRMTHELVLNYGIFYNMEIYRPLRASHLEMMDFHSKEYIEFLRTVTPETLTEEMTDTFLNGDSKDCPIFDDVYRFCSISAGGSIAGAVKLNREHADIAINWAGGLHHAKKGEASGFCYVNDIVLAILELLKYHPRVLYIDIDIHHGDGVEEAFYTTDRVMTLSFHQFEEGFFPETGKLKDRGKGKGLGYSLNFPLKKGITDEDYERVFEPVVKAIMEHYQPGAVVLQCGADSLAWDRIGDFNLTLKGHSKCISLLRQQNIPLLLLGGGGYNIKNVARCWALETAVAVGCEADLSDKIPHHDFYEYFGPDYKLHIMADNKMENMNQPSLLDKNMAFLVETLRNLDFAPSVQMMDIPGDVLNSDDDEEDELEVKGKRISIRASDKCRSHQGDLSDSEDEDGRRNQHSSNTIGGKRFRLDANVNENGTNGNENKAGTPINPESSEQKQKSASTSTFGTTTSCSSTNSSTSDIESTSSATKPLQPEELRSQLASLLWQNYDSTKGAAIDVNVEVPSQAFQTQSQPSSFGNPFTFRMETMAVVVEQIDSKEAPHSSESWPQEDDSVFE